LAKVILSGTVSETSKNYPVNLNQLGADKPLSTRYSTYIYFLRG